MGGYNSLPIQSGRNPYLDEIDAAAQNAHAQLSPGAQMALKKAGAPVGMTGAAPEAAPQITNPRQPIPLPRGMSPDTISGPDSGFTGAGPMTPISSPARAPQPQVVPPTAAEGPAAAEVARLTAPPPSDPNLVHTQANTGTAGVNQIHNPWARVPLQILGAVGAGFAPGLTAAIPGTELHHQMLVREAEGGLKQQQGIRKAEEEAQGEAAKAGQETAQAANLQSEADLLHPAQAEEAQARAWSLLNPQDKEKELNEFVLWHKQNPDAPVADWLKLKAETSGKETGLKVEKGEDGSIYNITKGPDGKVIAEELVHGNGKKPQLTAEERGYMRGAGGNPDDENTWTPQVMKKYSDLKRDKSGEASIGTWTLQEGPGGKPVLFNTKTSEMKDAPAGLQPRGTEAKTAPERDAITYAENYIKGGKFTASGDEALMDQFFALAKPKRMNAQQNEILMKGRNAIQGLKAQATHLISPDAPYFDDTQRQNIVQTMRDLATSQGAHTGGAPSGNTPRIQQNSKGEFRYSTDGGKTWQAGKPPQ